MRICYIISFFYITTMHLDKLCGEALHQYPLRQAQCFEVSSHRKSKWKSHCSVNTHTVHTNSQGDYEMLSCHVAQHVAEENRR